MFIPFTSRESDPQFEELQEVLFLRAALINNHMFFELRDLPDVERNVEIQRQTERLCEMSH